MSSILATARAYLDSGPVSDLYAAYLALEAQLVSRGWPATSPWWLRQLERFWATGRRRLAVRVGRRGGKSSTLCRVAVVEALWGQHEVPPGDVGVFAFFSVSMREARQRLRTIRDILDVLGRAYDARGDEVGLGNRAIRVYPASVRTAVGFTCLGAVHDELARWRDDATGANPATEVLRSVRPAMATQPRAHEFLSSSPWSTLDAHYEAMALGDTEQQCVATAPTWVANPTLTESACRAEEPDDATFAREYGARPMAATAATVFDVRAIEAAVADYGLPRRPEPGEHVTAGADFGFRRDSSALVVVHRADARRVVGEVHELRPGLGAPLRPSDTVSQFAARLRVHGADAVMADQHYRESITELLAASGVGFLSAPVDVPSTYVHLRTMLNQGLLTLPRHKQLLRDLAEVQSRPTANGGLTIILPRRPGGGHADTVSALVLACYQRGGVLVRDAETTPAMVREALERAAYRGWTEEELGDVERTARRVRADRGGESYISDDGGYLSETYD